MEWHHIAVMWNLSDSSDSEMMMYVDGVLKSRNPTNPGNFTLSSVSENLSVGTDYNNVHRLDGLIDEFRIYDEARKNIGNESFFIFRCGDDSCDSEENFISCFIDCKSPVDLNNDNSINIHDLSLVTSHFGLKLYDIGWNATVDTASPYGEIDVFDLVYVASKFT
jgi:hypothetical protein